MTVSIISEKKVFEEPDANLKSPFHSEEEMLAKAKDGYFVRDPERNLVICPAGNQLRQNQVHVRDLSVILTKWLVGSARIAQMS